MGLDMYLHKRTYVKNWSHMKDSEKYQITILKGGKPIPTTQIDPNKILYIIQEAGYWRKANAIHSWFVENIQEGEDDCKEYYVSPDQLKELLKVVTEVLEDHSMAEELLPTQEGFFFGDTGYDEWYFKDLELTKQIIEDALKDPEGDYEYTSSW